MLKTIATLLGNPVYQGSPYRDHTPGQLAALAALGVNTVFANMAWSRRWLDAVTLEDVAVSPTYPWLSDRGQAEDNARRLRQRVDAIVDAGLRPFFLFGCPAQIELDRLPPEAQAAAQDLIGVRGGRIDPRLSVACIQLPAVRQLYRELLAEHFRLFPETAGILFYTMDELAEVCDELDDCPRCHGVPLHERLPDFLAYLRRVMGELKPGVEMWWEPWEFTAEQTFSMVERLAPGITVSVHTSIHETYYANRPDGWLRHLCRLAADHGVPVIPDLFTSGTGEDLGPLPACPCPRLVYEQVCALDRLPAVAGVKEYFGTVVEHISVNERALQAYLQAPESDFTAVGAALAASFGPAAAPLLDAWEQAARAVECFPWDLSWRLRQYNSVRYDQAGPDGCWGPGFVSTLLTPWLTPSWESSRLAYYAVARSAAAVNDRLLEETYQRLGRAAGYLTAARERLEQAAEVLASSGAAPERRREIEMQTASVRILRHLALSRRYHLQGTRLAAALRGGSDEPSVSEQLLACLGDDLGNARQLYALVDAGGWLGFDLPAMAASIETMADELAVCRTGPRAWAAGHFVDR